MIADGEHQRAGLEREPESTFWWARRDRIKLPVLPIIAAISVHQRFQLNCYSLDSHSLQRSDVAQTHTLVERQFHSRGAKQLGELPG